MTLRGVGIDIADVGRLRRLLDAYPERFARRWFDPAEIGECDLQVADRAQAYACRFAAKEAVWKAISVPWTGGPPWRSIVVLESPTASRVRLDGQVGRAAQRAGVASIEVTWTCRDDLVLAVAFAEIG